MTRNEHVDRAQVRSQTRARPPGATGETALQQHRPKPPTHTPSTQESVGIDRLEKPLQQSITVEDDVHSVAYHSMCPGVRRIDLRP